jgi:Beta propeller domain
VYSNADKLVLAQPDYRWGGGTDFGIVNEQQTALHVFDLSGTDTKYVASGFVFGTLPVNNPQFGIDVAKDGTLRLATTGWVREQPQAKQDSPEFWRQRTDNRVLTARQNGAKVELVGKSVALGHDGEQVQSARFVGDRGYVVTYRQKDPLIVVDVANAAAPTVLGELEIPGFSQYVHPIDANHLVTVGQSGTGGIRLQLFDVTNPKQLPPPRWIDFGSGSSTEASYNHKALTAFEDKLALPMYSYQYLTNGRSSFLSTLEVIKVDVNAGFTSLASIDHARLYADNGAGVQCGSCDMTACYDYACAYQPELRRGHFVKGDDGKTFVYSFSYAGVLVHDLGALGRPVAKVGLPAPVFSAEQPWYGTSGTIVPSQDAGVAVTPPKPAVNGGTVMVP